MRRAHALPVGLALVGSVVGFTPAAFAQGLSSPNVGTSASSVVTVDPAAAYWNPANLASLEEVTLLTGLNFVLGDIRYQRDRRAGYQREDSLQFAQPISPANVDPSKTGLGKEVSSHPFGPTPSLFGAVPLAKGLVAGLGIYLPYAAIVNFDEQGPQRWSLQSATIATVYVTPSIGYRISEELSVGAGASYVLGYGALSKVQDFAALDDVGRGLSRKPIEQRNDFGANAPTGVRELSTMARPIKLKNMISHSGTFNLGAAVTPTPALRIGLAYQHSVPIKLNGKFSLDMNDDFFTQDLKTQGLAYKRVVEGDATLAFTLPRAVHAGVSYEFSDTWGGSLAASYTFWSQVEAFSVRVGSPDLAQPKIGIPATSQIDLPRRWVNTISVIGTARYRASPDLRLWVLGGYHSSAVPDATIDAASPDGNAIIAGVGAGYAITQRTSILGDFKVQTILPRTVTTSDHDLGNGEYHLSIYTLGVHLSTQL